MDLEFESYLQKTTKQSRAPLSYENYYRVMKESKDGGQKLMDSMNIDATDIIIALASSVEFLSAQQNKSPFENMPEPTPAEMDKAKKMFESMGIDLSAFDKNSC